MHSDCTLCDLHENCKRMVTGDGPTPAPVLFIAEAPGEWEDNTGIPLHKRGRSGGEFNHNCQRIRLPREKVRVTNLVKCRPKNNKNPKDYQISTCTNAWLGDEIDKCNPQIIATVGAISTHFFLGKVDMERVHGVPFEIELRGESRIILPIYHPSAGLRDPNIMMRVNHDFVSLGEVLRKQRSASHLTDEFPNPEYYEVTDADV